jgi:hypothetical protein
MTTKRKQIAKLIARAADGTFIFCDDLFSHGDDFQGATGTVMRLVTVEEYNERTDPDEIEEYLRDIWQEQVRAGATEESLKKWAADAYATDGDDLLFDQSYAHTYGQQLRDIGYTEERYPVVECIGGGRIFSREESRKYEHVYAEGLLKLIIDVEGGADFNAD